MMSRRKLADGKDPEESESLLDKESAPLQSSSLPTARASSTSSRSRAYCWVCTVVSIGCSLWFLWAVVNLIRDVFPETDLVLNSKCSAPMQNWDGKILNFQVWWSSYTDRPPYYNLHNENEYRGNDTNHHIYLQNQAGAKRPVVLFGTHHKTGTFLAKKLFARICSKMNWCCLFHVTRDSIHALSHALQTEPVSALGHNQWIWSPQALDIANYRFVHFYRHPYKKVISGYRYHADGTEEWTQKALTYDKICSSPLVTGTGLRGTQGAPSPKQVWDFCETIHLCETCCRMEHEKQQARMARTEVATYRRSPEEYAFLCDKLGRGKEVMDTALEQQLQRPEGPGLRHFHHTATPSIQEMLLTQPAREGILTEAALDFYENLRMASIINETAGDSHTLNIDIDDLNDNFSEVTLRLLRFLEGVAVPSRRIQELHRDLAFYDLQTSPVYRWSMSNPIVNHITGQGGGGAGAGGGGGGGGAPPAPTPSSPGSSGGSLLPSSPSHLKGTSSSTNATKYGHQVEEASVLPTVATASSAYLMGVLRADPQVTRVYAPILEMMQSVLMPAAAAAKGNT